MSEPIRPEQLHGSWLLERFVIRFADGRPPVQPFGERARGLLMYTPDGRMSAILSRADRPPLAASRLETSAKAPAEEKAGAFDSYLSYGGRWTIEGDEVVHAVEYALTPNLVGRDNRRRADFRPAPDGDRVVLSYDVPARSGVTRHYSLTWRRP